MSVRQEEMIGDLRVVWIDGPNMDAAAVAVLRREFLPSVETRQPLLLCVEQLEFIDSIGMSLLRRLRSLVGDDNFAIASVNDRLKYCMDRFPPAAWPNAYENIEEAQIIRDRTGSFRVEELSATSLPKREESGQEEEVSVLSEESWVRQTS